jgi:hypothetical protein
VVDHRPDGACECGADLAEATDEGVDRACQVTDVPLVRARTTGEEPTARVESAGRCV